MNVLFITSDDLGLQLSSYGETLIQTPHLDKLAASGVQFDIAYVAQASCSPSRSAMFTGLHTHGTGQYGLTNTGLSLHTHLRDATIPNLLKKAGYRTGIISKLHVAPEDSFQFDFRQGIPYNTREVRKVAKMAEQFFDETGEQRFFLMVNYYDPHVIRDPNDANRRILPNQADGIPANPLKPSEKTLFAFQQIDTPEQRERTAGYYNCVMRLDEGVGMLMEVLEKHGHTEDTLVIFVGDHGPPFCRGKTTVYESGLRIPFLVRWPGVSKPMRSQAMVSTIDILPTILDATQVEPAVKMHGRSLHPVLQDANAPWREYLVGEFHFHGSRPFYPRRAIRDHRYKLIHNLLAGKGESRIAGASTRTRPTSPHATPATKGLRCARRLTPSPIRRNSSCTILENDPIEFENLAGTPELAEVEARLKNALLDYRKETEDPFLDSAYIDEFIERAREGDLTE